MVNKLQLINYSKKESFESPRLISIIKLTTNEILITVDPSMTYLLSSVIDHTENIINASNKYTITHQYREGIIGLLISPKTQSNFTNKELFVISGMADSFIIEFSSSMTQEEISSIIKDITNAINQLLSAVQQTSTSNNNNQLPVISSKVKKSNILINILLLILILVCIYIIKKGIHLRVF